jgi:hypothetical protein
MVEVTRAGLFKWFDGGVKVVIALAVPVVGVYIDSSLKLQTAAIEKQNTAFEQLMKTREKNVDLTFKFYDVINSKRFECYDESNGPLLKVFIDTNNAYNAIKIQYADIANSLLMHAISEPTCKAFDDAKIIRQNHGLVPTANSAPGASHKNSHVKNAAQVVSRSLNAKPGLDESGDGWVSLGHHDEKDGFLHFELVDSPDQGEASLQVGSVLKASHAVYLRYTTDDTVLGDNPILAVLSEGTCAEVKNIIRHLRGNTWARVDVEETCPNKVLKRTAER